MLLLGSLILIGYAKHVAPQRSQSDILSLGKWRIVATIGRKRQFGHTQTGEHKGNGLKRGVAKLHNE